MQKIPYREQRTIAQFKEKYGEDIDASTLLSKLVADAWSLGTPEPLYNAIWRYQPVDGRTFYEKFLGEPLWPVQQEFHDRIFGLDPIKFRDTAFQEGYCFHGKGSGKDATVSKMFTYACYLLCCLRNPNEFLSWGNAPIDIGNVSLNARQAKAVFFKHFKSWALKCIDPETGKNWFATKNYWKDANGNIKYMDLRDGRDIQEATINFGRGIAAHSLNSETYTGEGLNLLFIAFDELGAFPILSALGGGGKRGLYDSLKSTFVSRNHKRYGAMLVFSYKYDEDCPMSVLVDRNKSNPDVYISHHPTFEVNPNVTKQSLVGEYLKDPDIAKRTFECLRSGKGIARAIRRQEIIELNINTERINPIISGNQYTVNDLDKIDFSPFFRGEPNVQYRVHIDGAKGKVYEGGDAVGFCLAHPILRKPRIHSIMMSELAGMGINAEEAENTLQRGIYIDLMLQIVAPAGYEVILADLRRFVWKLKIDFGFGIFGISLDGWQSTDSVQDFRSKGMAAEEYSVDKKMEGYDTLKSIEYQGLIDRYHHEVYEREIKELMLVDGKYVHPEYSAMRAILEGTDKGSKDVSDAVAGVTVKCLQSSLDGDQIALGFVLPEDMKEEDVDKKQEEWNKHADEVNERKRQEFESGDSTED